MLGALQTWQYSQILHSDGVHTHSKETKGEIRGINFEFKKNELPYYANWMHLYFFFDKILEVIEIIIQKNPKNILTISWSESYTGPK